MWLLNLIFGLIFLVSFGYAFWVFIDMEHEPGGIFYKGSDD